MRSIILAKSGLNKIKAHHTELKSSDFSDSIKGITPGEWCLFNYPSSIESWIGFVNPLVDEKFTCAHVLKKIKSEEVADFIPEKHIESLVKSAFIRRGRFAGYSLGARFFYGAADGLPGLIIDGFTEVVLIQINTAGIDKYRDTVARILEDLSGRRTFFLDNPKYREKEFLPTFSVPTLPEIKIHENGLNFRIRPEVMQKVGFYYDHRENRRELRELFKRLSISFKSGLDLFCYAGAWGASALAGGVEKVDFVDQGELGAEVQSTLELNDYSGRGTFHRMDVFKFLDLMYTQKKMYDVILCDPPAFAKSSSQKEQALEGYSKLHRKVLKIADGGGLVVFSSCTHYVSPEEFQKNILDAAHKESKKLQLIYTGIQGWDHPVESLSERGNYIKSYFYLME